MFAPSDIDQARRLAWTPSSAICPHFVVPLEETEAVFVIGDHEHGPLVPSSFSEFRQGPIKSTQPLRACS